MSENRGEGRILIIDDDQAVADTLGQILRVHGYDARMTYSAESAIDLIAEWPPDVAIVDVILPKMNGIDFGLLLKENYPESHVLLFSGSPSLDELLQRAGAEKHRFQVLTKPVHPAVMLEAISNLLPRSEIDYSDFNSPVRSARA